MVCKVKSAIIIVTLVMTGCGEPLNKSDVKSKYSNHTVSKLTREQRYLHLGPNDRSLGTRYIYHSSNGRAYYFKETPKGYRRRESGRWWAGEDKICYSMRITRAEDVEKDQCAPAGTDVMWSSFVRGDTKGLAPRHVATSNPKRTAGGNKRRCVTGLEDGCSYGWLKPIAGAAIATGAVIGKVCSEGACDGLSAAGSNGTNNSSSNIRNTSSQTTNGWKITGSTAIAGWSGRKKYYL